MPNQSVPITTRAVLIPVEGEITRLEIPRDGLSTLQEAVEGYIEALPLPGFEDATVYVNEEGKYTCLDEDGNVEVNLRATALLKAGLFPGDFITGPCVIAGFDASTGEHVDLPAALFSWL